MSDHDYRARPRHLFHGERSPEEIAAHFAELGERVRARISRDEAERAAFLATPEGQESEARKLAAAERARLFALRARAEKAGCPEGADVRGAAFALDTTGPAIDAVLEAIEWARGPGRESYGRQPAVRALLGERGVGKTVALTYALTRTHRSGYYVTADEITRTHRAMHDNRFAWAQWTRCDLLAVDEAGLEEKPEVVSHLLLDRWASGGITLIAGNISRPAFIARYLGGELGPRLLDRLGSQHAGGLVPSVVFTEPSRRAKPAAL